MSCAAIAHLISRLFVRCFTFRIPENDVNTSRNEVKHVQGVLIKSFQTLHPVSKYYSNSMEMSGFFYRADFKHENLLLVLLNVCLSSLRLILWFSSYPVIFLLSCDFPLFLWLSSYPVTFLLSCNFFYLFLVIFTYFYFFTYFYLSICTYFYFFYLVILLDTWILVLISWIPASKNFIQDITF